MQLIGEGPVGAQGPLHGERRREVGGGKEESGVLMGEDAQGQHPLRSVDEGQPLLGFQRQRVEARPRQCVGGGLRMSPVAVGDHPLPCDAQGNVRELGEVAAGADGATAGNRGVDPPVHQIGDPVDHVGPHARIPR
jgi:hypothetical protein